MASNYLNALSAELAVHPDVVSARERDLLVSVASELDARGASPTARAEFFAAVAAALGKRAGEAIGRAIAARVISGIGSFSGGPALTIGGEPENANVAPSPPPIFPSPSNATGSPLSNFPDAPARPEPHGSGPLDAALVDALNPFSSLDEEQFETRTIISRAIVAGHVASAPREATFGVLRDCERVAALISPAITKAFINATLPAPRTESVVLCERIIVVAPGAASEAIRVDLLVGPGATRDFLFVALLSRSDEGSALLHVLDRPSMPLQHGRVIFVSASLPAALEWCDLNRVGSLMRFIGVAGILRISEVAT